MRYINLRLLTYLLTYLVAGDTVNRVLSFTYACGDWRVSSTHIDWQATSCQARHGGLLSRHVFNKNLTAGAEVAAASPIMLHTREAWVLYRRRSLWSSSHPSARYSFISLRLWHKVAYKHIHHRTTSNNSTEYMILQKAIMLDRLCYQNAVVLAVTCTGAVVLTWQRLTHSRQTRKYAVARSHMLKYDFCTPISYNKLMHILEGDAV